MWLEQLQRTIVLGIHWLGFLFKNWGKCIDKCSRSGASLLVRVCSIINVSYKFNENYVIHLYERDKSIHRRVMKKIQCILKNHGQLLRFNNVYTVKVFDVAVHS